MTWSAGRSARYPGTPSRRSSVGLACIGAFVGAVSLVVHGGQARAVTDRVYADAQAARGQQIYQNQCLACHGPALDGAVGPPLAGDGFVAAWSARSLADLVDKIEKTMPPQQSGSISRAQAIDLVAFILRSGKFPSGPTELGAGTLGQIAFPTARAASAPAFGGSVSFAAASNLAQLMRGVTFPNANILFNVQVKDPGTAKPTVPVPFDYVLWGSTVYYGWPSVDQAALALIETSPLFLLPGRRCENGRPAPVGRADWQQYTAALVEAGRAAYKASQSRNIDAVIKVAEQLSATCDNCHKVYRDGGKEGTSAGAARCQ
jgi:mono/diheme cytochrome c family protein